MSSIDLLNTLSTSANSASDDDNKPILAYLARQGRQPDDMLRFFDRCARFRFCREV